MKVLFMQENPTLPTALSLTLMSKGFSLIFSSRTKSYITQIDQESPAVVIIDLSNINWKTYVNEAKQRAIPVIVICDLCNEDQLQDAFDAGVNDYISLPLSFTELALRVSLLTMNQLKKAA